MGGSFAKIQSLEKCVLRKESGSFRPWSFQPGHFGLSRPMFGVGHFGLGRWVVSTLSCFVQSIGTSLADGRFFRLMSIIE